MSHLSSGDTTSRITSLTSRRIPAVAVALLSAIIVGLVVIAFTWPAATSQPQNLPVGIIGPEATVDTLTTALDKQDPSPLELRTLTTRDEAVNAIEKREIYGAIVLGDAPEVLIASAAGAAPAQALRGIAAELQHQIDTTAFDTVKTQLTAIVSALQSGATPQLPSAGATSGASGDVPTVTVTDVVPLVEGDTMGGALSSIVFPLVLGGIVGGLLISQLLHGRIRRLVALAIFGVCTGATITAVMQSWLGILGGDWLLNAGVVALAVTATAAFITGCATLLEFPGIALGVLVTLLLANPISGAAIPAEFLPGSWGAVGQFFAPGAGSTLLRSVAYFPAAPTWPQWLVLSGWTTLGVLLLFLGRHNNRVQQP